MPDNFILNGGTGTLLAADDVLGTLVLRVKVQTGADGVAQDVSTSQPMPVSIQSFLPGSLTVSGAVDVVSMPSVTIGTALPAGGNLIGAVEVASLPALPPGTNAIGSVTVSTLPSVTIGSAIPAGANNIGSVQVASLPALPTGSNAIGIVEVSTLPTLPAGSNNIGKVQVTAIPNVTIGSSLPSGLNTIGAVNVATLPSLPSGGNGIGSVVVSSIPALSIGAALPAGTSNIGKVDVASIAPGANTIGAVQVKPGTGGGLTIYRAFLSATGVLIRGSSAQVYGWHLFNSGTSVAFVKLFNLSSAPTVGTSVPSLTLMVPGGGVVAGDYMMGLEFSTGLGIAATAEGEDDRSGAVTSFAVLANIFYK